jgi:hypothetical protein
MLKIDDLLNGWSYALNLPIKPTRHELAFFYSSLSMTT